MLALAVVALWSLAEGFLWFIVADVPISVIALRYGLRRGAIAALIAAPMAALGGLAMVIWTRADPELSLYWLAVLPGSDLGMVMSARLRWDAGGFGAMVAGAFSGVPYKFFAHAAAFDPQLGTAGFLAGSVAARLPRFLLMAVIVGQIGRWLTPHLRLRWQMAILALSWTAFYVWYFS